MSGLNTRFFGSGAYPMGGYLINPQTYGLSEIDGVSCNDQAPGATGAQWIWNTQTNKLQMFVSATGQELADGTNDATAWVDIEIVGF